VEPASGDGERGEGEVGGGSCQVMRSPGYRVDGVLTHPKETKREIPRQRKAMRRKDKDISSKKWNVSEKDFPSKSSSESHSLKIDV